MKDASCLGEDSIGRTQEIFGGLMKGKDTGEGMVRSDYEKQELFDTGPHDLGRDSHTAD